MPHVVVHFAQSNCPFLAECANAADIDLASVVVRKIQANAAKYPIETAYGKALKYNELPETTE